MKDDTGFYTLKGYLLQEPNSLSSAKEDYLEMITRLSHNGTAIKVNILAKLLHVKASSVTKMLQQLMRDGFLYVEKYGIICLTEKGHSMGEYLLYRHNVLQDFLCMVNHTESELEEVEKIEHFLDERTIKNLELLTQKLNQKGSEDFSSDPIKN